MTTGARGVVQVRLDRTHRTARATYGTLAIDGSPQTYCTLELPWLDNAPDRSCIPGDCLTVFRRRFSPHNQREVFTAVDVPGRTNVNIEVANFVRQLLGCIAIGTEVFDLDGDGIDDLEHSRNALEAFMAELDGIDEIHVTITEPAA